MRKIDIPDLVVRIKIHKQPAVANGNISHRLSADQLAGLFDHLPFTLE
jgi:hypothetical protein